MFDYTQEQPSGHTVRVAPRDIIILEDTLDFTDLADLVIFTYAPDNVLIERRLKRDSHKTSFSSTKELETYLRTKSIPAYQAKLLPVASRANYIIDTHQGVLYETSRRAHDTPTAAPKHNSHDQ